MWTSSPLRKNTHPLTPPHYHPATSPWPKLLSLRRRRRKQTVVLPGLAGDCKHLIHRLSPSLFPSESFIETIPRYHLKPPKSPSSTTWFPSPENVTDQSGSHPEEKPSHALSHQSEIPNGQELDPPPKCENRMMLLKPNFYLYMDGTTSSQSRSTIKGKVWCRKKR